ncbi:MAG TPA: class I SAM-dependent methyltransferase [Gemmatimonadota bacterium]|nr:class I SAM-dependent methyltransferase [Gemmatimonadota bacterium]
MDHYYDRFPAAAARYDALHAERTADVAFYVEEARAAGGRVLEVGCGTARVTLPIAAAGVTVTGLDRSGPMLDVARANRRAAPPAVRRRLALVCADMRAYAFRRPFDRVFIPYRAFQAMESADDQRAALAAARAALAMDGRLVFDVLDPRPGLRSAGVGGPVPLAPTGREIATADGGRVVERFTIRHDPGTRMVETTFVYEREDATGAVVERSFEPLRLRCFLRDEIERLLARAGFRVEALYRGWENATGARHGGDQVWVARKDG